MKSIYLCVTNDLTYDQRMHRICGTLAAAGYQVTLVGRKLKTSRPLTRAAYRQKRLHCIATKGAAFYAEYNLRLFMYLATKRMDAVCAIDLDTILPCLFISRVKKCRRVYDAHEFFTELKEVRTRPAVQKAWLRIERFCVPEFRQGYTVSNGLAAAFYERYNVLYDVVRNLPVLQPLLNAERKKKLLTYQGAINEGRGFESLIPAMKSIDATLMICGDGNFMHQLKRLIKEHDVADRVELRGMLLPTELKRIAAEATIGIGLAEKEGLNQFQALPNKFTDYLHAALPQVTMNFPEYQAINNRFAVALLLDDIAPATVAAAINELLADKERRQAMSDAALAAREVYCWQEEEKKLLQFYQTLFAD